MTLWAVRLQVGWYVGLPVIISQKEGKCHFHAHIEHLFCPSITSINISYRYDDSYQLKIDYRPTKFLFLNSPICFCLITSLIETHKSVKHLESADLMMYTYLHGLTTQAKINHGLYLCCSDEMVPSTGINLLNVRNSSDVQSLKYMHFLT